MLNLKRIGNLAIVVISLGSSAVFAGSMGPVCTPGNVVVPCVSKAWDVSAQALYLQPTYSNGFDYVDYSGSAVNRNYQSAEPNWGWGFKLAGSYYFNTGNDLDINWYHMHDNNHTTVNYFASFSSATSSNIGRDSQWDAVNVEFGQKVNFSEQSTVRFHGGIEYARIASRISNSPVNSNNNLYVTSKSTYNGLGPRIGADLSYDVGNGFSVYGNGAGSLLIGDINSTGTTYTTILSRYNYGEIDTSNYILVPELEAKLGAIYTHSMAQGALSIDVGWMWVNYFNAQENTGLELVTNGAINSDVGGAVSFGEQGPFVGLKWLGNV